MILRLKPISPFLLILKLCDFVVKAKLTENNEKMAWIVGKWRSEFSGKVFWPTVPTMTYGEELIIAEAPMTKTSSAQFLNFRYLFKYLFF